MGAIELDYDLKLISFLFGQRRIRQGFSFIGIEPHLYPMSCKGNYGKLTAIFTPRESKSSGQKQQTRNLSTRTGNSKTRYLTS
jgi:hypothetical protein